MCRRGADHARVPGELCRRRRAVPRARLFQPGRPHGTGVTRVSLAIRARGRRRTLQLPARDSGTAGDGRAVHGKSPAGKDRLEGQHRLRAVPALPHPLRPACRGHRHGSLPWRKHGQADQRGQGHHPPGAVHGFERGRGTGCRNRQRRRAYRGCRFRLEDHRAGLRRELARLRGMAVRRGRLQRDRPEMLSAEHPVRTRQLGAGGAAEDRGAGRQALARQSQHRPRAELEQ